MTSSSSRRLRICFVCTHSLTLTTLYKGLFPHLSQRGFEIDAVVGDSEYSDFPERHFGKFKLHIIPMQRTPSIWADICSLIRLLAFFARNRYDIIHISTPKASLLTSIAARLTFNGPLVFVHRRKIYELYSGLKRKFYASIDRLICKLSFVVVPICRELGDDLIKEGHCDPQKLRFLASGSSNGIDVDRFEVGNVLRMKAADFRSKCGIPTEAPVLFFLGRLCREKGADHLPAVFDLVRADFPELHMIVAGPDDERDPIGSDALHRFSTDPSIHRLGFVDEPEILYAACDVFVFPSYFEGFGNVLLEAAAAGRVAVAFDVPGVREAIAHGTSGFLAPLRDELRMATYIIELIRYPSTRAHMAKLARERVVAFYRREKIWGEIESLLLNVIDRRAIDN